MCTSKKKIERVSTCGLEIFRYFLKTSCGAAVTPQLPLDILLV